MDFSSQSPALIPMESLWGNFATVGIMHGEVVKMFTKMSETGGQYRKMQSFLQ